FIEYYYNTNPKKMAVVHILDLVIAANKVLFPLPIINAIAEAGEEGVLNTFSTAAGISLLGFSLNIILPRIRDYIVGEVRNNTQKKITIDMVKSVYGRELDNILGTPSGSCAVLTSKNYGSIGQ